MHRLPKIFTHKSDRRKSSVNPGLIPQAASRTKPKLERCNAVKNINYECSPASTSASSSSSYFSSDECLRTRSLELYGGKTSFRFDGVDGEMELLCKTLGFSGIEDFAIPVEEYAAMKLRSSSAPVVFSKNSEPWFDREVEVTYDNIDVVNRTSDVISMNCEEIRFSGRDSYSEWPYPMCSKLGDNFRVNDVVSSDNVDGRPNQFRGTGIKGVRPPVLVPPSLISLPSVDEDCSTSEMFRAFAPDNNTSCSRYEGCFRLNGNDVAAEVDDWKANDDAEEGDMTEMVTRREENYVLSESYSFTTSSNGDSSITTTPMSSNSPNRRSRRVIVDWQKGELLGRGSFGSVYEGIADDGFFFAVKEVSLLDQDNEGKQRILQFEQEIALLSQFEHENIVQYYGTEKDESHLYIFLELVTQGSLLSLYRKYNLKDLQVSAYTRQILHGLKYLHGKNVVHRDIKCANILVDTNGLVKLADFGLAKATKLNDVKSCKGTPFWMAPEVVRSLGYGLPADIWSLGCSVLEMLTRSFPYSNLECMAALFKIGRGERPPIPDSISRDARDFILNCLQVDPDLRPTAAQLLDHPFVKRPLLQTSGSASPRFFSRHN